MTEAVSGHGLDKPSQWSAHILCNNISPDVPSMRNVAVLNAAEGTAAIPIFD